jgi:hypothetical protein
MAMLRFLASDWNEMIRELERLSHALNTAVFSAITSGNREVVIAPLERIVTLTNRLGLPLSSRYASELISIVRETTSLQEKVNAVVGNLSYGLAALSEPRKRRSLQPPAELDMKDVLNPERFRKEIEILSKRIDDELRGREFFAIEHPHADYFAVRHPLGEAVGEAFPSIAVNAEEAAKCLALDRATASVFHLMRVMETGLKVTAGALGIPYAPSWESYLRQIDSRVQQKYRVKGVRWKRDEPFFRDVSAHLHAVKAAWRNPTMHVVRDYTPEQAEDIFRAVRIFMAHLATRLHE